MEHPYHVKIDAFEGPLDLLLHLIKEYEIDIHDIPVAEITEQYTNYIHTMQHLELDIASEYLVMAATLLALKSQMLLPKQRVDIDTDEYMEDPRDELMKRLIEYRKFKKAAEHLKEKKSNQIYTRSPVDFKGLPLPSETPISKGDLSIYDMLGALNKMFERKSWDNPLETKITRIDIPVEDRMQEIIHLVRIQTNGIAFDQLFSYKSRSHIVVTFIALLELMRNNDVFCKQDQHFDLIYVFYHGENSTV